MTGDDPAATPDGVLEFWFADHHRPLWFKATGAFDEQIRRQFTATWIQAIDGRLDHWRTTASDALALVIVLDQLPLNMFRGRPEAFAGESAARRVADEAVRQGFERGMTGEQKAFLYLPFMHSENLEDQDRSVALFEATGMENNLRWARHHREIVRRFGRFPHRNAILGRQDTDDEVAWLASPEAFHG